MQLVQIISQRSRSHRLPICIPMIREVNDNLYEIGNVIHGDNYLLFVHANATGGQVLLLIPAHSVKLLRYNKSDLIGMAAFWE